MPDLVLGSPVGAESVSTNNIWTPTGVDYIQSWIVGKTGEDNLRAIKHEFKCTFMGESKYFGVLAEEGCSDAQIEDMAAGVFERTAAEIFIKTQMRFGKLVPTDLADPANLDVRRDLSATFRDYRKHARKRRDSSNGRIYYPGIH